MHGTLLKQQVFTSCSTLSALDAHSRPNGTACLARQLPVSLLGAASLRPETKHSQLITALHTRSSRANAFVVRAGNADGPEPQTKRLPIFPLGIVALPSSSVPLRIFEARYRVLFNTLLAGAEGLEEGLVNEDSPFCGTKAFGMCMVDQRGNLAATGTTLHIEQFKRQDNGQMLIVSQGTERFRITRVVEEKPVLICEVQVLSEDDDTSDETLLLAGEVAGLLRDTLRLRMKLNPVQVDEALMDPEELTTLGPRELSYWITSLFADSPMQQQLLLEEDSTRSRLARVKEILEGTLKYLSATNALKSALSTDAPGVGGEDLPRPPAGGPD